MIGGIIATIIGLVAAYYVWKNLDKIYDIIEDDPYKAKSWGLRLAILVLIFVLTAGIVGITEGVPVIEYLLPIAAFVGSGYFFLIRPTMARDKKPSPVIVEEVDEEDEDEDKDEDTGEIRLKV